MKAIKVYEKIQKLNEKQDDIPWNTRRLFREGYFEINIMGSEISFGEDYVSIEQAREGIQFIVEQLGGKVDWSDYEG